MKNILLVLLLLPVFTDAQIITTIAGNHIPGYSGNGGPATSASMYQPNQLTVDGTGNVYIAESGNNVVRKVSPSGIISVVAGTHYSGYSGDGGQATDAQLSQPLAVALDATGNLYISEQGNNVIRKVNTSGIISTIAGNGASGYSGDGAMATAANLNGPFAMTFDTTGNLYIADLYNNRIRKVTVAGIISTIAGTGLGTYTGDGGPATNATFYNPIDLAFDNLGNLYIDDFYNNAIRKINSSGIISTICGDGTAAYSGDGGDATAATLSYPYAICLDRNNNIYVTDNANERIRVIDTSGIIETVVGNGTPGYSGDGGLAVNAEIHNTGGIFVDTFNNMFIADYGNNVIRKVSNVSVPLHTKILAETHQIADDFVIYPNPATNQLTVSSENKINQLTIVNLIGQTVYKNNYNNEKVQVDVSGLPIGMYLIRINGSEVRKFVKQ